MPVTSALPIKQPRRPSGMPETWVKPRGNPFSASNSSGVSRRNRPLESRTTCVVRDGDRPPSLVIMVLDGLSRWSGNASVPSLKS